MKTPKRVNKDFANMLGGKIFGFEANQILNQNFLRYCGKNGSKWWNYDETNAQDILPIKKYYTAKSISRKSCWFKIWFEFKSISQYF